MNARYCMSVFLVLLLMLITAGCMQTTPPATPTPTAVQTIATELPTMVPTTLSLTPGPTQTLPEVWGLEVQVYGNGEAINPRIIVSCQGGKGLNFIQQIDVKVTRPDGVVVTDVISKPLYKGKEVSLPITAQMGNVNRVEVWATTPQGDNVKIFDDYVPFRTYN
ncbi:MAG: hypothetical protein EHM53_02760 [Methanoregulaceae archaeon]|nr:MAG: hypothetical protein EHM53_02760 [Methanoregulaceae archaeon]